MSLKNADKEIINLNQYLNMYKTSNYLQEQEKNMFELQIQKMQENIKVVEDSFKDNKIKMEKCFMNVFLHQKQIIDKIVSKF